ncbi:MAG: hypothetical protein JSW07_10470 [bacterium]|nr:MAG: hypothetical protein JSW07_10470 [bacterium]
MKKIILLLSMYFLGFPLYGEARGLQVQLYAEKQVLKPNNTFWGEPVLTKSYKLFPKDLTDSKQIIYKNKVWDGVKKLWNKPVEDYVLFLTKHTHYGVFVWTGVHSFVDAVTDAKAHSRGKTKYLSGDGDWHIWKNFRDGFLIITAFHFARNIFIEKRTTKEVVRDIVCIGLLRAVIFNTTYKIVKGGFGAYNDPYYNRHNITYWKIKNWKFEDGYISTGRASTPLVDALALGGFLTIKICF